MEPKDLKITDWYRIFIGEVPPAFMLEVVLRVFFIFIVLMVAMRLMGKRMAAQLSRTEMAALVSLAASTGVAVQDPSRGIIPVAIIGFIVVSVQRLVSWKAMHSATFEQRVMDDMNILAREGGLCLEDMERSRITRERLFAQLRSEEVDNLGRVQRLYLEANGKFTLIKYQEEKPGLSIVPKWDKAFLDEQKAAEGYFACGSCGNLEQSRHQPQEPCKRCQHIEWREAVLC